MTWLICFPDLVAGGSPGYRLRRTNASIDDYGIPVGGAFSYVFPSLLQPSLLLLAALTLWGGPSHVKPRPDEDREASRQAARISAEAKTQVLAIDDRGFRQSDTGSPPSGC